MTVKTTVTTLPPSAADVPPPPPPVNPVNGFEAANPDEPEASSKERVRDLLKAGAAQAVSFIRAAPALVRTVWNERRPWIWVVLALFLMALPPLRWAVTTWLAPSSAFTFQLFVPLAVGLLLWNRREQIAQQHRELLFLYGEDSPKRRGNLWPVSFGCVLLLAASITMLTPLALFALVLIIGGVAYYLYGPFLLRPLLLPLSYLLLMITPPVSIIALASTLLRYGSLLVAGQMLQFFFKDAQLQGAFVVFPSFVLQVSEAASGITLLLPLLAFALWLAILRRIQIGSSLVLLVVTVAIASFLNVLRLFLIGVAGALSSETGNALQTEGALWFSSLFLGLVSAYLVYKIAVLLSPPRLI